VPSSEESSIRTYPAFAELIPAGDVQKGPYSLRFAGSPEELDQLQRLRFEVFNLELGEGLDESFTTGRDEDRYDPVCHHLLVIEPGRRVIGTYRMQTNEMARDGIGFYSEDEFDLSSLPERVLRDAVEVGRACVAQEYRNRQVLFLLWRGLAAYMTHNRKRYLFGCCSLTSQDPAEGKRVMDYLVANGHALPDLPVRPRPEWVCYDERLAATTPAAETAEVKLPKLFSLYLRYGAKVCGPPAIDRFFKTIDYLVLLDLEQLAPESREMFFG
jgi:putative hemolysin